MLLLQRKLFQCLGLLVLPLLLSLQVSAQSKIVKGTVLNAADGKPLPGISVVEKGTNKGTQTSSDGAFTMAVSKSNATLTFSSVGFQSSTVVWDGKSNLEVKLEQLVSAMQDVVVVGYGTQKKINQTGSTQTVKFDDAVNAPVTNAGQLMYGKFSGVQITQGSGLPGADASSVIIRGVGTFGSSVPLVVIDNIQYVGLDAFNNLSPSDIESVSILKDASAGAIYGARGANGVIIVTTKKGKAGAGSVIYNTYLGFQEATVVPQYLGSLQYATLKNEGDIYANGHNTRY